MKTRTRLIVVVGVIAAGASWWLLRGKAGGADDLFASGTVEATDADLGFSLPGRVAVVLAAEGQRVPRGAELARLDARELEAALDASRARLAATEARLAELTRGSRPQELATAEAALRAATQRVEETRRDADRARTLFEGGAISQQVMERAQTALDVAIADEDQAVQRVELTREGPRSETVDAQRSLVEQTRAEVALAEARLANAVIIAPFDGVVTVRHREPGESVTAGAPVLTLLDPDDRWVRIYVRGDAIGRVRLGLAAQIRSDTYPQSIYPGEVVFVGSEAEFTPRNVQTTEDRTRLVYPVKVKITGDLDFVLKPGVPADVTIVEG
jgi:HlyD family secretion protein